jgi:RNA polymerase primary sigma factor
MAGRGGPRTLDGMSTGPVSTEEIAELIARGERTGCLPLSEVQDLGDRLPQKPLEALFERLAAHGIDVRDDCARAAVPPAVADGAVAPATVRALWLFLREVPPPSELTAGEELELAMEVERGDRRARDRLIDANLPLVVSVARRHQGGGLPLLDLLRAGVQGLVRAIETFDWRLGHELSVHATWSIHEAVGRIERDAERVRRPRERVA